VVYRVVLPELETSQRLARFLPSGLLIGDENLIVKIQSIFLTVKISLSHLAVRSRAILISLS
jgi:hypothetical protein